VVGLAPLKIQGLIKGAFLHDVGKIGVRDNILLKPGRLDTREFEVMKSHVSHGLDIVNRSEWLDDANQVVAYHHEKFDGSGYFAGLKGEEIPLIARIFAIADVFDALTSRRPYKDPVSFQETMEILENEKGCHFDPQLVDTFAELAEDLYQQYAGKNDDYLKDILATIRERYFQEHTVFH
jgi:HD-GYP domain-containing protein (c-di-GMP phosphodiesterase class II)